MQNTNIVYHLFRRRSDNKIFLINEVGKIELPTTVDYSGSLKSCEFEYGGKNNSIILDIEIDHSFYQIIYHTVDELIQKDDSGKWYNPFELGEEIDDITSLILDHTTTASWYYYEF